VKKLIALATLCLTAQNALAGGGIGAPTLSPDQPIVSCSGRDHKNKFKPGDRRSNLSFSFGSVDGRPGGLLSAWEEEAVLMGAPHDFIFFPVRSIASHKISGIELELQDRGAGRALLLRIPSANASASLELKDTNFALHLTRGFFDSSHMLLDASAQKVPAEFSVNGTLIKADCVLSGSVIARFLNPESLKVDNLFLRQAVSKF